ncbi:DUF4143 domain-containing protein, partial [Rhizobium ruizarguesonis]
GLLSGVRGLTFDRVKADRGTFGALLESFLFSEVLKLMTASYLRLTPYHFRDRDMREVDIVLERDRSLPSSCWRSGVAESAFQRW